MSRRCSRAIYIGEIGIPFAFGEYPLRFRREDITASGYEQAYGKLPQYFKALPEIWSGMGNFVSLLDVTARGIEKELFDERHNTKSKYQWAQLLQQNRLVLEGIFNPKFYLVPTCREKGPIEKPLFFFRDSSCRSFSSSHVHLSHRITKGPPISPIAFHQGSPSRRLPVSIFH